MRRLLLILMMLISSPAAMAQDSVMTRENVDAFYQAFLDKHLKKTAIEDLLAFFDRHVAEDAAYVMNITKEVAGTPRPPETLMMDKAQTRDRIKKLHVSSGGANTGIAEVLEAAIYDSGRSANVKMHMFGEFIVPIKGERGMTEVQATQELFCDDELVLNSAGDIQIKSSTCKIHARMGVPGQKIPMPVKDTP